jgi:hypothetical protein
MSPRGNKGSQAGIESRREKISEIVDANPSVTQGKIAQEVGSSLSTIKDDLAVLRENFRAGNKYAELVEKLVDLGIKQYEATHAGQIPPDVANACTNILRSIGKWTGAEVSRSISARVDANPEHSQEFLEYRSAVAHLNDEQKRDVLRYAKSLPNLWKPPVMDASFFPPAPQLTEGEQS